MTKIIVTKKIQLLIDDYIKQQNITRNRKPLTVLEMDRIIITISIRTYNR